MAAGAAFAAAELLAGILVGGFFGLGRAEALIFLALRPWLLLVLALLVARLALRERAISYLLALLLAALSESILLTALGAGDPWPEAARGLAGGALVAAAADAAVQLGRRLLGRLGPVAGAAAIVLLLTAGKGFAAYEAIVLAAPVRPVGERQDLMLLSALPLVWGELGPLDDRARPAAAYGALEREFRIRPLDALDARSLGSGGLLLAAQPRALAPEELVALDDWVRGGGRALILTDPMLHWPSELPFGDVRRPPAIGLLGPLLAHWGLELEPPRQAAAAVTSIAAGGEPRRIILFAPGRFRARGGACAVRAEGLVAECRLGKGRAILIPDADMMHDRLWVGPAGAERHGRISDNPLLIADLLDELAGRRRERTAGSVQWIDPAADRRLALLLAFLPLLSAAAPAGALRLRRRQ